MLEFTLLHFVPSSLPVFPVQTSTDYGYWDWKPSSSVDVDVMEIRIKEVIDVSSFWAQIGTSRKLHSP